VPLTAKPLHCSPAVAEQFKGVETTGPLNTFCGATMFCLQIWTHWLPHLTAVLTVVDVEMHSSTHWAIHLSASSA